MARQLTVNLELEIEEIVISPIKGYVSVRYVWRRTDTNVIHERGEARWWKQLPAPAAHPITGELIPNPPNWFQMTASRKTSIEAWVAEITTKLETVL